MNRFRAENPQYATAKMTYAGRLDPIAEGVLIVLAGDEVHNKASYTKLDKTYTCTALLGFSTDTYDFLGIPIGKILGQGNHELHPISTESLERILQNKVGTFMQEYPAYSSKTIQGKQMHILARENALPADVPKRAVTVYRISDVSLIQTPLKDIVSEIVETVLKIEGDFRQDATIQAWQNIRNQYPDVTVPLVTFTIDVSSGTYIRGIVHDVGQELGIGACIIRLVRTRVGEYILDKLV